MSRIYTTVQGDMWDMIAYNEMGSVDYTDDLMNANSSLLEYFSFPSGIELTIPDVPERSASTLPWAKRALYTILSVVQRPIRHLL